MLVQWAVAAMQASGSRFVLLDVGVSGGLDPRWRLWEPVLVAHGFDPIVDEIERLRRSEINPCVRYHDCYVICDDFEELQRKIATDAAHSNASFHLTSAARAARRSSTGAGPRLS